MSPKQYQKCLKLRNVIIMLLLVNIGLFAIGILTRTPTTINESRDISSPDELLGIQETLIVIQDQLNELKEIQLEQENTLIEIQEELTSMPLTGPALYANFVDEIVETVYPDISADYVKAIIWHESRYEPWRVSTKTNATGLMQIIPRWHVKRAESLGVTSLLDPYGNILVGCDILNELTQGYSFEYALNFFAGGYPYADRYKNSTSPFIEELNEIIYQMETGVIVLGGE